MVGYKMLILSEKPYGVLKAIRKHDSYHSGHVSHRKNTVGERCARLSRLKSRAKSTNHPPMPLERDGFVSQPYMPLRAYSMTTATGAGRAVCATGEGGGVW